MKQKVVRLALLMGLLVSISVVTLFTPSGGEVLAAKLKDEAQNIPATQGKISPHEYAARRKREASEFLSKGEWQKAVEVYDDIANKYPFTDQALLALSQKAHVYWAEMEKRPEAASTYRLLAERAAHMIVELQMRRARAITYQAIHGPTRGDPAILQEAVEEYRLIVDKFPGEKDAVFKAQTKILGLYRRLGENEKALQLCKEMAALPENQSGSRSAEVLSQLAFCYKALERWKDAEKAWLEAIKQHPDYDYYRIMIDVVYRKLGKPEKAEEQYLTIVNRAREDKRKSKAYCYIGRLWLDEGQYERAIPYYQKALDLDAQYNIRIHTLSGIGRCYEKLGMLKEAVEVNDKLAEFIGDKYPAWNSWRDGARATAERLRQELEYNVNTIEGSERSQVDKKTINDIRTSDQNKAGKERMRQLREKQVVVRQVRDYEEARTVPQPIELWKVKEYGCGGSPRTALKLRTDVKRQYPILLTWPLIQDASKYVVQIQGLRGSRPARSFESTTNSLRLEKADLLPGRYQWSVSVYDRHGKHIGNIETIDPVEIFAIEDPQPVAANGKRVMIDLNHSAGHIRGWGYYNHAQYITKELLENAGFEVQVNERDLLTIEKLKSVDLLICHYYWAGWPGFRPYLKSELSAVRQFVEKGGSLLVVGCDRKDGGGNMSEAGNELVKEFGLLFELDKISEQHNWAEVTPNQNVISLTRPVNMQLPVGVTGENATTLLQFDGVPIVKAKQFGYGKVIVAGVGMSFLDCYLGDFEHRKSPHQIMFYDFIKYLTGIDWKEHCRKELVDNLSLPVDSKKATDAFRAREEVKQTQHGDLLQIVLPPDSTMIDLNYVTAHPDDDSTVQDIEHLLILRECTYEVDTQDLLSGQTAEKSVWWAISPSIDRGNQKVFPVELIVETEKSVTPHSNYPAEVENVSGKKRLHWTANQKHILSHFGYFGSTTQETVTGVEIRRKCEPLGNGRARIKIIVRAQTPLLIRIWGLKRRVNIEPESIQPQTNRLSDNGVLFFDYGKNSEGLGSESECSFVISGLNEGELFYPMTNALRRVWTLQDCSLSPVNQVRGSIWDFDFTLKSERCFRIARLKKWVHKIYQLKALTVEPSQQVGGNE